jgi:hypothetical protein
MQPPLAYIDPGSGSLILQVVIAGVVAIPFFLRSQIRRAVGKVKSAVGRGPASPASPAADDAHDA